MAVWRSSFTTVLSNRLAYASSFSAFCNLFKIISSGSVDLFLNLDSNSSTDGGLIKIEKTKIYITGEGITAIKRTNRREFGLEPDYSFCKKPQEEESDPIEEPQNEVPQVEEAPFEVPSEIRLKLKKIKGEEND